MDTEMVVEGSFWLDLQSMEHTILEAYEHFSLTLL